MHPHPAGGGAVREVDVALAGARQRQRQVQTSGDAVHRGVGQVLGHRRQLAAVGGEGAMALVGGATGCRG